MDSVKKPVIRGPALIFVNNITKLSFARRKITRLDSDALRDLVPFVKVKKREKHRWRSITFRKVADFKALSCRLPHGVFFTFLKLYRWYQIMQNIKYKI